MFVDSSVPSPTETRLTQFRFPEENQIVLLKTAFAVLALLCTWDLGSVIIVSGTGPGLPLEGQYQPVFQLESQDLIAHACQELENSTEFVHIQSPCGTVADSGHGAKPAHGDR